MTPIFRQTFAIRTRSAFITLFGDMANGVDPAYLLNRRKIPVVLVTGSAVSGKCAAVEAMMRTWSDRHSLKDMAGKERRKMFLEHAPGDGIETVKGDFFVQGQSVKMIFNSRSFSKELIKTHKKDFYKEQTNGPKSSGAALFYSDNRLFENDLRNVWIWIDIEKQWMHGNAKWHRNVSIEIMRKELKESSRFQECWQSVKLKAEKEFKL